MELQNYLKDIVAVQMETINAYKTRDRTNIMLEEIIIRLDKLEKKIDSKLKSEIKSESKSELKSGLESKLVHL